MCALRLPRSALAAIDSQADAPFASIDKNAGHSVPLYHKHRYGSHFGTPHKRRVRGRGAPSEHGVRVMDPLKRDPNARPQSQLMDIMGVEEKLDPQGRLANVVPSRDHLERHKQFIRDQFYKDYQAARSRRRAQELKYQLQPLQSLASMPNGTVKNKLLSILLRTLKKPKSRFRGRRVQFA